MADPGKEGAGSGVLRLAAVGLLGLALLEALLQSVSNGRLRVPHLGRAGPPLLATLRAYWRARHWALEHPWFVGIGVLTSVALGVLAWRQTLLFWSGLKARLTGTAFRPAVLSFPNRGVDLIREIRRRPAGHSFVGITPRRTFLGWRCAPSPSTLSGSRASTRCWPDEQPAQRPIRAPHSPGLPCRPWMAYIRGRFRTGLSRTKNPFRIDMGRTWVPCCIHEAL
jgi:hypothetical protein